MPYDGGGSVGWIWGRWGGLKWSGCNVRITLWARLPHGCHRLLSIMPMYGAFTVQVLITSSTLIPASAGGGGGVSPPSPPSGPEILEGGCLPSQTCVCPGTTRCHMVVHKDPHSVATLNLPNTDIMRLLCDM